MFKSILYPEHVLSCPIYPNSHREWVNQAFHWGTARLEIVHVQSNLSCIMNHHSFCPLPLPCCPPGAINTTYCISTSSCVYHLIPVSINIHPFIHRITLHSLPNPIRPPGSFISNHSQHNKVRTACLQTPLWVVYLPLSGNTSY